MRKKIRDIKRKWAESIRKRFKRKFGERATTVKAKLKIFNDKLGSTSKVCKFADHIFGSHALTESDVSFIIEVVRACKLVDI